MSKPKTSLKRKMNISNGMLIVLGIIIGIVLSMIYVYMTSSKEDIDAPIQTSYRKWITQAPQQRNKPVKELPKRWVEQRTNCRKKGGNWYDYNNRIKSRLIERNMSGLGGECWDLSNKQNQITHLCCNFKV